MKKVIINDSDNIKNLLVQIDIKKQTTLVFSNFTAWDNMAYLLEALAVTVQKCINDGIPKDQVYNEIKQYFMQALSEKTTLRG